MKVVLSYTAKLKLQEIFTYIQKELGTPSLENFGIKLKNKLRLISIFPESSPKSLEVDDVKKCVVTKQITLYYRIDYKRSEVQIITIVDSRQSPSSYLDEI